MIKQIHYNTAFEGMSLEQIEKWINIYRERLIGSAIFTKNNSITSKIVRWAEKLGHKCENFTPSHTGSIIEYNGEIYSFDMKPLKAKVTRLADYIYNTKDDFVIMLRDFDLDTFMFSKNIAYHIGEFYPFLSAIGSVLPSFETKYRNHCSELHLRELQKQDIYTELDPECTPDSLYHFMLYK